MLIGGQAENSGSIARALLEQCGTVLRWTAASDWCALGSAAADWLPQVCPPTTRAHS